MSKSNVAGVLGRLWHGALVGVLWACLSTAALAQAESRADPVTGQGVTTIGNIPVGSSVNLRSGPGALFPRVATLGYGTRVETGICIGGGSARWCKIETVDGRHSGYVSGRFLVDGAVPPDVGDGLDGGPDYWAVRGLAAGDRLNVRRDPAAGSPALATLSEGEVVRNLGCRMSSGARWCRIRSVTGMDVTGWVAGRYLRESAGPSTGGNGGGPDRWVVAGLAAGDTLNVRTQPTTQGQVVARLQSGAWVLNQGCRQSGATRWCQIRTTGGVTVTGWVNGRYLRKG